MVVVAAAILQIAWHLGEEKLASLIHESLATAARTGAVKPSDFTRVIVDTTVQPKAVAFPTDAKLMHRARERPVRLAKKAAVPCASPMSGWEKRALIAHQRYAHAKQFKRANRALRTIRTYLGRVTRDLVRKTADDHQLRKIVSAPVARLWRARAAPASAGPEDLFPARPRGRMHRQGQGASTLRIWRQGLARHHASSLKWRPVHRPCEGDAGQPLRRPYFGDRPARDRGADRRALNPHRRRPRLSRPQRSARHAVQGLYLGPDLRAAVPSIRKERRGAERTATRSTSESRCGRPERRFK
jgi:hypothetical protein